MLAFNLSAKKETLKMIFWLLLFLLLIFNFKYKKNAVGYLKIGIYLFCLGAILAVLSLNVLAEFVA